MLLRPSPPSSAEVPKAVVCNTKKIKLKRFLKHFFSTPSPPTGQPLSIFGLSTALEPHRSPLCDTAVCNKVTVCRRHDADPPPASCSSHPPGALVSRRPSAQHFCTVVVNSGSSRNRNKAPPPPPHLHLHPPHSRSWLKERM